MVRLGDLDRHRDHHSFGRTAHAQPCTALAWHSYSNLGDQMTSSLWQCMAVHLAYSTAPPSSTLLHSLYHHLPHHLSSIAYSLSQRSQSTTHRSVIPFVTLSFLLAASSFLHSQAYSLISFTYSSSPLLSRLLTFVALGTHERTRLLVVYKPTYFPVVDRDPLDSELPSSLRESPLSHPPLI